MWLLSGGIWLFHESPYESSYEFHRGNTSARFNSWNTWIPHKEHLNMDINLNTWLQNGKVAWVTNVGELSFCKHVVTEIHRRKHFYQLSSINICRKGRGHYTFLSKIIIATQAGTGDLQTFSIRWKTSFSNKINQGAINVPSILGLLTFEHV